MKVTFLLLLLFSTALMAYEDFSIEESFKNPVRIPASIISYLKSEVGDDTSFCEDVKHEDLFESQIVSLNKSTKAYLVKPSHMCLCGAYYCPMWMFLKGKKADLLWSSPATGMMAILNTKSNGYAQIKDYGGAATHGFKSISSWIGKSYKEVYRQDYMVEGSKGCVDVETFRLKGGKLVSVSKACLEDIP